MDYFGRLKKILDGINDYDPLDSCECSGCKCDLTDRLSKKREQAQIRSFFMGLNPYFQTVRSQILGTKPLPSLDDVYSRIVQEEDGRPKAAAEAPAMAFAVRGESVSRPQQQRQGRKSCTFCWEKHGYPEGRGPKRGNRRSDPGEPAASGTTGTSQPSRANVVFGEQTVGANYVRLTGKNTTVWIIDTGASTHVTGDLLLFDTYTPISPLAVGFPDGKVLKATHSGRVTLNDTLILANVLYAPNFTCNLLSVSQLLSSQKLEFHFTNSNCVIQDPTLKTRIGVGDLLDGLYQLRMEVPKRVNVIKDDVFDLWHRRLGHPSVQVMEYLPQFKRRKDHLVIKSCDICFRAKQTRSPFPLSINKAAMVFDLIHVDVWGPYKPNRACGSRYFLSIVDDCSRRVWVFL
ncbi:hypothetical protein RND81_07G157600 [Saponaria officinalis]|uniref:GAG-pre-integrase domain-containing protein n=1 Tax=Saponaria officinalis TaxID=3572 RepID=A0AAW1JQU4_SAPOF